VAPAQRDDGGPTGWGRHPGGVASKVVVDRATRRRFRDGDPDAVRVVYREYGRLVFAVALRALGDRGLAEEVTQQVFVKAWRAAAVIDDSRELAPWLAAIARRTAIDVYRREALRAGAPLEAVAPDDPAVVTMPESVESMYETWEVREAVGELPDDEREVVRLQHFEGMTHGQIADQLGVAVGTVKSRSFRAHKRLATALGHLRE
jgi:RNA polymerase sigma factor (sigma-70 family)